MKYTSFTTALAITLLTGGTAFAQIIDNTVEAVNGIEATTGIADPGVTTTTQGTVTTSVDTGAGQVSTDTNVQVDATVDAPVTTSPLTGDTQAWVLTRENASEPSTVRAPESTEMVLTEDDFHGFASILIRQTPTLTDIHADAESIKLKYLAPGKLLALFPVKLSITATVTADGSINVKYPWYKSISTMAEPLKVTETEKPWITAGLLNGTQVPPSARAELISRLNTAVTTDTETDLLQ